jgi:hypothetical protein
MCAGQSCFWHAILQSLTLSQALRVVAAAFRAAWVPQRWFLPAPTEL